MPALLARQMLDGLFLICGENKGAYFLTTVASRRVPATGRDRPVSLMSQVRDSPLHRWRTGHESQDRGKSSQISTLKAFASFSRFTIDTFRSPRSAELT